MSAFLILSILIGNLSFAKTETSYQFISEADDVEREAWWLITGSRLTNQQSPWRFVYKALLDFKGQKSKHVVLSLCQKIRTQANSRQTVFRMTTECQSKPVDMATVKILNPSKWEFEFRVASFVDHYGLGTSIFYPLITCQVYLNRKNRVQKIQCPTYARNRNVEEIVELRNFEFNKQGEPLMRIQGVIKRQFQDVAKIETSIPAVGKIEVKEIKIPNALETLNIEEFKPPVGAPQSLPASKPLVPEDPAAEPRRESQETPPIEEAEIGGPPEAAPPIPPSR